MGILNANKIPFKDLYGLHKAYIPEDVVEINMFINLEPILAKFYQDDINKMANSLDQDDRYLLSSELLNICAHYRNFFYSRMNKYTTFFCYWGSDRARYNCNLFEGFRKRHYSRVARDSTTFMNLNKLVKDNMEIAQLFSEYLPNIYFIDTQSFDPSALPYYVISANETPIGLFNLVLSKKPLDYQLVSLERTYLLVADGENSYCIKPSNVYRNILKKTKQKTNSLIHEAFIPLIYSISGLDTLNIKGVSGYGLSRTISSLEKMINSGQVENNELFANNMIHDVELLTILVGGRDNLVETIQNNYKVISYSNIVDNMTPIDIHTIGRQFINRSDNMGLNELITQYYERYPLMMVELMMGEES